MEPHPTPIAGRGLTRFLVGAIAGQEDTRAPLAWGREQPRWPPP